MVDVVFYAVPETSDGARLALQLYFDELLNRFSLPVNLEAELTPTGMYSPPHGVFVLSGSLRSPRACGAVTFLDEDRGEIKRMWVAPIERGQGIATKLLTHLEGIIQRSGRTTSLLDSNSALVEAVALYQRSGYRLVEQYNGQSRRQLLVHERSRGNKE